MDSNTHSTQGPTGPVDGQPSQPADDLALLMAALDRLDTKDLGRLADSALTDQTLQLRPLAARLDGIWLKYLAAVDARGAAGAEAGVQFGSTAGWLRARLRMSSHATAVRTGRALFRGPLAQTAQALCKGELSAAHAQALAAGTQQLPAATVSDAEATLVDAARQLDPTGLRRLVGHLQDTIDPDGADAQAQRRYERRGLWLTPTIDALVAVHGLLEAEAGQTLVAALEPLARPADHHDSRTGGQRTADALHELARRSLEAGRLPKTGGVRPQLQVVVDLDSLVGDGCGIGGDAGWAAPLAPKACRRLACDATLTRVVVTRQRGHHRPDGAPHQFSCGPGDPHALSGDPHDPTLSALAGLLRAVLGRLPSVLGGAASMPLDLGRATRVVSPAQRNALAVRDGGCVFPGCARPLAWCEAHHVRHWLDGGPTDLDNLALVCRAHHRAIHDGGWQLTRGPDGRFTATPPYRGQRTAA